MSNKYSDQLEIFSDRQINFSSCASFIIKLLNEVLHLDEEVKQE